MTSLGKAKLRLVSLVLVAGVAFGVALSQGCGVVGTLVSDVQGWDLSACVDSGCGRETCMDLFFDNEEKILGGRTAVEAIQEELFGEQSDDTSEDVDDGQ